MRIEKMCSNDLSEVLIKLKGQERKMTVMWKGNRNEKIYRFQTDDKRIADKLTRREKFTLSATGLNCKFWIFIAEIGRPSTAKKILRTLTGKKVKYNAEEEIFTTDTQNVQD